MANEIFLMLFRQAADSRPRKRVIMVDWPEICFNRAWAVPTFGETLSLVFYTMSLR